MAWMALSSEAYPVTRITSTSGFTRLRARATSSPEPSPRFLSTRATSSSPGSSPRAIASRADAARTRVRPSPTRNRRNTSRITGSSSTIRIVAMCALHVEPHARRQAERRERTGRPRPRREERRLDERGAPAPPEAEGEGEPRRGRGASRGEERAGGRRRLELGPARAAPVHAGAREDCGEGRARRPVETLHLEPPGELVRAAEREPPGGRALHDEPRAPGGEPPRDVPRRARARRDEERRSCARDDRLRLHVEHRAGRRRTGDVDREALLAGRAGGQGPGDGERARLALRHRHRPARRLEDRELAAPRGAEDRKSVV